MGSLIGKKRQELIASGKTGHKVLVFGRKVFRDWAAEIPKHENAEIDAIAFPSDYSRLGRLSDYSLVILDYSAFYVDRNLYENEQEVFEKQMFEALDTGTTFCFVYYDEHVPKYDQYAYSTENMNEAHIKKLRKVQIGFRWLDQFSVKPYRTDDVLVSGKHSRNEFRTFLDKWAATHNAFETYGKYEFDDQFYSMKHYAMGFTINVRNGKLIYIPFQRDFSRKEDVLAGLGRLIDSCITYITNTLVDFPAWANQPFFDQEKDIRQEIEDLEQRLEDAFSRLSPFRNVKSLLLQSQYSLERSVPEFISKRFGIPTERDEKYLEDFWLLDKNKNRIAICEVKSIVKGFKKSAIFSVYNHREEHKLEERFPALLIANTHMQAGSWEDKDKGIDPQDYHVATQNSVLVLRVVDLVRLWFASEKGLVAAQDILKLLLEKGWLQINYKLQVEVLE